MLEMYTVSSVSDEAVIAEELRQTEFRPRITSALTMLEIDTVLIVSDESHCTCYVWCLIRYYV